MDAQSVYDVLIPTLEEWGLDLTALAGQGYDGAAMMSGSKNGLHKKVSECYPNALYVHCRFHALNLALAGACTGIDSVQDLFDNVAKITNFLDDGTKRKHMFMEVAATGVDDELTALLTESDYEDGEDEDEDGNDKEDQEQSNNGESSNDEEQSENEDGSNVEDHCLHKSNKAILTGARKRTVPKLCPTRWSSRVKTLSALIAKYSSVLKTLEQIADHSNGEPRRKAQSYIHLMEAHQFIVALVVVQCI